MTIICYQGPPFRLAFVFSINSFILPGFSLTSFHLAKASPATLSWLYIVANEIKTKTKLSHVTFKLTMRSIVPFSLETVQWYH